jgi:hypothetical protein
MRPHNGEHASEPLPRDPRTALQDRDTARLFQHYLTHLAPWYDLSDADRSFGKQVPHLALNFQMLLHAIFAFAAIHVSRTTMHIAKARAIADQHHSRCVELLLTVQENDVRSTTGVALAAVCLLRSYEILAEDIDPNRHLSGAYASSSANGPALMTSRPLLRAGFFNYLREDITYSLINRQPLKMDLSVIGMNYVATTDEEQLNAITLLLARICNVCFAQQIAPDLSDLADALKVWYDTLPGAFMPYSGRPGSLGPIMDEVYMLGDCYTSANQYYLVAKSVLLATQPSLDLPIDDQEWIANQVCGHAFTS